MHNRARIFKDSLEFQELFILWSCAVRIIMYSLKVCVFVSILLLSPSWPWLMHMMVFCRVLLVTKQATAKHHHAQSWILSWHGNDRRIDAKNTHSMSILYVSYCTCSDKSSWVKALNSFKQLSCFFRKLKIFSRILNLFSIIHKNCLESVGKKPMLMQGLYCTGCRKKFGPVFVATVEEL